MASLVYNGLVENLARGNIDFDAHSFKVMLVTSAYTPDKDAHEFRSSVTNQVVGTGYTAGGKVSAVTITPNDTTDRVDMSFASVSWDASTITARAAVIYRDTGNAATDILVAYVDFGSDVASTAATFAVSFSTPLRLQN